MACIVKEKNKETKKYNFQHSKCPDSPALDLSPPLVSLPSGNSAQTAGLIKHSPAFRVCYFSLSLLLLCSVFLFYRRKGGDGKGNKVGGGGDKGKRDI